MSEGDDFTVFMPEYDKLLTTVCEQNRRLQAIADAPKCEHGNIYPHLVDRWFRNDTGYNEKRCDGVPDLADLLDAQTKEER